MPANSILLIEDEVTTRELDLLGAYAMGRIRVTGDLEAGMRVLPLMDAEPYRDLNRRIHGLTAFV